MRAAPFLCNEILTRRMEHTVVMTKSLFIKLCLTDQSSKVVCVAYSNNKVYNFSWRFDCLWLIFIDLVLSYMHGQILSNEAVTGGSSKNATHSHHKTSSIAFEEQL